MGNARSEFFSQKRPNFWNPLFFQSKLWDPLFLMREPSFKRHCLSVCPSVCLYVTLFYKFVKCTFDVWRHHVSLLASISLAGLVFIYIQWGIITLQLTMPPLQNLENLISNLFSWSGVRGCSQSVDRYTISPEHFEIMVQGKCCLWSKILTFKGGSQPVSFLNYF